MIARGAHLAAIRANGLRLITGDDDFTVRCPATDDPAEAGVHDYVILTLKAHQVPPIATSPHSSRFRLSIRIGLLQANRLRTNRMWTNRPNRHRPSAEFLVLRTVEQGDRQHQDADDGERP